MLAEIEMDKQIAVATLKAGLAELCADDITKVLINLESGTCDYLELIPVLEQVAATEWFYYFDDNGAGGFPHADIRRKSSFKSWALKAIENIRVNAQFASTSMIHEVLKSNNTGLIKNALEQLKAENKNADQSLVPILDKIARKNEYDKYSYLGGFETDCLLGELARDVIQMIVRNSVSTDTPDRSASITRCSLCSSLPDDLTVNTGRDEYLPNAFSQLITMDDEYRAEFRCCPACRTYFNWIDMRQMYGSGNNDEERLVRLSHQQSLLLDRLFTAPSNARPTSKECEEYLNEFPLHLLVPALRFHLHNNREWLTPFGPHLMHLLARTNDTDLWEFMRGYVSKSPERAQEILKVFESMDLEAPPNRVRQIVDQCLEVLKNK